MKKEKIFILIIIISIILMALFSSNRNSLSIDKENATAFELSQQQQKWVESQTIISIMVSSDLKYLTVHNEETGERDGFLYDYLSEIFKMADLQIKLELMDGDQDQVVHPIGEDDLLTCSVVVVDDIIRKQAGDLKFSTPILQIQGSLFLASDRDDETLLQKEYLTAVCVAGDLTEAQKSKLTYHKIPFHFEEASNHEEAVKKAIQLNADCIVGNQAAIVNALNAENGMGKYKDIYVSLYEKNVCIVMANDQTIFYGILDKVIHSDGIPKLLGRTQEKWFGIPYSYINEQRFSDSVMLILIILIAAFSTFFLYYQTNKNLYEELQSRMNQLLESQQEMETTFNGVSYYMAELDAEGIILSVNKAFSSFIEHTEKEPRGNHISDIIEVESKKQHELINMIQKTKAEGTGQNLEMFVQRGIFKINTFPIENRKGDIDKILFMASDVTEIRSAERQILQDNKMIAVGQLAAGVAHEIRNPLGLIRNYCYVLKNMESNDEEQKQQAIHIIEKSVDTSNKIITNLLNFSRASTRKKEAIFIKNHLESLLVLNEGEMKNKQISIVINCREDFKVNICVESLDMVLINLLTNAMDAIQNNGQITVNLYPQGKGRFNISVEDTGSGIEADILDNIFNPFFTTKIHSEGNGLGLYIVYNEISKMDGKIEVESTIGRGTVFTVNLPL